MNGKLTTERIRLAALAAGAALAAQQWASLLAAPPLARTGAVAAVAVGLAIVLGRIAPARRGAAAATSALVLVAALAALAAVGLPLRCLPPWRWDDLASGVATGLGGLSGGFDYPLAWAGPWSRLLLVAPLVPLLIGAATLAFRPGRDRGRAPVAALIVLLLAVAIPASSRPTAAPMIVGVALLALAAAWLWGDRVRTLSAAVLVAAAAVVAVPVATGLASDDPPIDYRDWTLPGPPRGATFDWSHTYGPIDWQRSGELLFRVRTDRPNYWRAELLDEFYGDRWRRSGGGGAPVAGIPPGYSLGASGGGRWEQQASFRIVALESPLVISPGSALRIDGIEATERDPDGTMHTGSEPLAPGSNYSLTAYAPDPRPAQLRAASRRYPPELGPYTQLALPTQASLESILAPVPIQVPVWGQARGRTRARRELAGSAYARAAHLAERLTAGEPTAYDAAVAVVDHLRADYRYDESTPRRRLPLRAFLFRDKRGYCQQFSGAMALLLRMVGVPARVATGFAPGTRLAGGHRYLVTDLDAHSWVEVYFNGIGWVPFDPTPPIPAEIRGAAMLGAGVSVRDPGAMSKGGSVGDGRAAGDVEAAAGPDGGGGPPIAPAALIALLAGAAFVAPARSLHHRRLPAAEAEAREVAELRDVLRATGWSRGAAGTLLAVEGRLHAARHEHAAGYVRCFRRRLYEPVAGKRPMPADRRAARRELASGSGIAGRLRLLRLMPPGGPRSGRRRPGGRRRARRSSG